MHVAKKELNLLQFTAGGASRAQLRRRSCGASLVTPILAANSLTTRHTSVSVTASPQALPALLTRRKSFPDSIPAAFVHSSISPWTQFGTGSEPEINRPWCEQSN